MIKNAINRMRSSFSRYIAAEPSNRRRDPGGNVRSSDEILTQAKRDRLTEGARELWRNYSVAAWAIRKHLDYVAAFQFLPTMTDPGLNEELENLMRWWGRPVNFDVAARHSLRRYMRLLEMRRVVDGDVFLLKLQDGRVQPIEGHRVRDPAPMVQMGGEWLHGVRLGEGGGLKGIAVHRYEKGRYVFEREVPTGNVIHLGYFDAFDQIRGVSPLSAAITQFQDVLEVQDYARAKAKITQLFALAITREIADFDDETDDGAGGYSVDFGKGPVKLELDPGDKAEFLESRHPSTEFLEFMKVTLQAALKALDIPWSFYDEAYTNFFGSKAALQQYQQACRAKRDDLKELLDRLTVWRLGQWIANGTLKLPRGVTLSNLTWDWVPAGVPWWDTSKEVKGDLEAIAGGLRTRTEIRRERFGDDWRDVVRKLSEEEDYLEEMGVAVTFAPYSTQPEEGKVDDDNG